MTLSEQIQMIDDMIAEDPETTIGEFLEALAEIDNIKPVEPIKPVMNTPKLYTQEQAQFMLTHHKIYTAQEMAEMLNIPPAAVYNYGSRNKILFKSGWESEKQKQKFLNRRKKPLTIIRSEAAYSNRSPFGIATELMNHKDAI